MAATLVLVALGLLASGIAVTSIMRHSLRSIPFVRRPEDIVTLPFTDDTSEAFRHAYAASFGDRPGYTAGSSRAWGRWLREQRGFQPEDSRVAMDRSGHVAGFVTLSEGWIEEVGVVPEWRGHRLGGDVHRLRGAPVHCRVRLHADRHAPFHQRLR